MNSGIVPLRRYQRDDHTLALLEPESLRVDLSIGKNLWLGDLIGGKREAIRYDWEGIDGLACELAKAGVPAYWSFCYTPKPFQSAEGWRSYPDDLNGWAQTAENFTRHFRNAGLRAGYYEI